MICIQEVSAAFIVSFGFYSHAVRFDTSPCSRPLSHPPDPRDSPSSRQLADACKTLGCESLDKDLRLAGSYFTIESNHSEKRLACAPQHLHNKARIHLISMFHESSSSLLPFKAKDDEDEHIGFAQEVDDVLAYDISGMSLAAAETGNYLRHASTRLTFTSAYALVVGSIIGSGIFASPSRVDSSSPSPGVTILVWLIAGLIAWAGAVAFAELGSAIPRNGGMQEYLHYIYGDMVASIMSRTYILASRPTSMAIASIVFAEYWTTTVFPAAAKFEWVTKPLAVATVLTILTINCISARVSTRFTNVLLVSKLSTVALVLMMAFLAAAFNVSSEEGPSRDWSSRNWFMARQTDVDGDLIDWTKISTWDLLGHLTSAMYAALFAFSGYENVRLAS